MTNAWSDLVNTTLDLAAERDALADRLAGVPDVPEGHELVVLFVAAGVTERVMDRRERTKR